MNFDNDEGCTMLTAYVERVAEEYVLYVEAIGPTDVEVQREREASL